MTGDVYGAQLRTVPIKPASCKAPRNRLTPDGQAGPLDLIFNWDADEALASADVTHLRTNPYRYPAR
jgi:hypothetical protein